MLYRNEYNDRHSNHAHYYFTLLELEGNSLLEVIIFNIGILRIEHSVLLSFHIINGFHPVHI